MTVALSLQGLTRRFGDVTAVESLSFDIGRGELFGIVGPDGAGKTTTLRMLAGVLPPSAGDALVLGTSVAREPEAVKPHIAYMSQRFGLYQDLTVRENIEFYADLYGVDRRDLPERIARLYRFSNLGEFADRLAGRLSGGMKQKLSLCCALVHHPRILLLDEPTFGVDPISRRDLWLILHQMIADGMTIVISTSYMDEAERCDRVALLNAGRVLALDAPAPLQHRFGGALFEVRSDEPRRIRDALRKLPGVVHATLFGDAVHVRLADGSGLGALAGDLAALGIAADDVVNVPASLEDVFIDRVAGAHV